jgi:hypothetical protein
MPIDHSCPGGDRADGPGGGNKDKNRGLHSESDDVSSQ